MEELVLKKLGYELTVPTSKTFLRRLLQLCNPDEKLHFMANYITELALVDYAMLPYPPSKIAASAVYLAQVILHRTPWDGTLAHYSTYGHQDLHPCVQDLALIHCTLSSSDNTQLPAIRDKYAHPKYHSVSRMPGVAQSQLAHLLATYY